ncbi:MAG: HEAT repeat domain-containing protein [Pseudomonadota bacterium]|nr:HEAT repeat domain-containing protein [Pseudomonadota bacterium]
MSLTNDSRKSPPDALLLMQPGCAHCPHVLSALVSLLEQGAISRLEAVNVMEFPQAAREVGTRSVPWTRIGDFELPGNYTEAELRHWAQESTRDGGVAGYYFDLLDNGHLARAMARVRGKPEEVPDLLDLLADEEVPLSVRVGVSAIVEDLAGQEALIGAFERIMSLTGSRNPATRADSAHFLGLSGSPDAIPAIRKLLQDGEAQVREVAAEALEMLGHRGGT